MESEINYLTVNQVLDVLIDKGTLSKDVADTLRVPLWQKEGPLDNHGPTTVFKELVRSAGYHLRYTYSDDRECNLYWLIERG